MSFRNNQRNNEPRQPRQGGVLLRQAGVVQADPRTLAARQSDARPWNWITDSAETEAACLEMLRGVPKLYPIFGIQLHVEVRQGRDGSIPVLIFTDAKYGEEGQNLFGKIRSGLPVGVGKLHFRFPKPGAYGSVEEELLVLTLMAQPEMQLARQRYFEEEAAKVVAASDAKRDLLVSLRKKVAPMLAAPHVEQVHVRAVATATAAQMPLPAKTKPEYPTFGSLGDIMGAQIGVFEHPSGVTLKVCTSGKFSDIMVIRTKTKDESHPLYSFGRANLCIKQQELASAEDDAEVDLTPVQILCRDARTWLRAELALLNAPQGVEAVSENAPVEPVVAPVVVAGADEAVAVTTAPAVDVADVLGHAATNGVPEGKKGVPSKRVAKPKPTPDKRVAETA